MRWAFPVWYKSKLTEYDIDELLEAGYSVAEVSLDYPWPYSDDFESEVKSLVEHGFELAFHAPWRDIALASPYRPLARVSLEVLKESIGVIQRLGPEYFIIHVQSREAAPRSDDEGLISLLSELREHASSHGIKVLVENTYGGFNEDPIEMRKLLETVGLRACLDVGRVMPRDQGQASMETIERWISLLSPLTDVVHVHAAGRSRGKTLEHCPITGMENTFANVIRKIWSANSRLIVTLEVFFAHSGKEASPSFLAKSLRSLLAYLGGGLAVTPKKEGRLVDGTEGL